MIRIIILTISAIFVTACSGNIEDIINFEHEASENYFQRAVLDELPQKHSYYFATKIKKVGHPEYYIWLRALSVKQEKSLKILSASVGNEKETIESIYKDSNIELGETRIIKNLQDPVYTNSNSAFELFHIENNFLERISENGEEIYLKVLFETDEGERGYINFEIERVEYKDIAWPT